MLCCLCRLFNASAERVMWRLRSRLFEHIIHQEVGFFARVRTGELMNRLSEVRQLRSCCCMSNVEHHSPHVIAFLAIIVSIIALPS